MPARYVNVDRETPMLMPPDLRDWVAKDDVTHFIVDALEQCDLGLAKVNGRGSGDRQYPPGMMLGLLIFSYAHGIFSSRQIEAATYSHVSLRYLCGNEHPDHDTIATFRRENRGLLENCFVTVLRLAKELKAFRKLGTVSVDGTKLAARASQRSNHKVEDLEKKIGELQGEIAGLVEQAERADGKEEREPSQLDERLQDRTTRKRALEVAKEKLLARQRASHEQRLSHERGEAVKLPEDPPERGVSSGSAPGGVAGPASPPPPPAAKLRPIPKRDAGQRINLVEADSRLMCNAHGEFVQAYNVQAVVEAGEDRTQLILGIRVTTEGNDRRTLAENLVSVPAPFRQEIKHVLADKGYDNADLIAAIEKKYEVTVLCPPQTEAKEPEAGNPSKRVKPVQVRRRALTQAMHQRMEVPENKQLYRRRYASIEPVFGVLKNVLGFRRFRLFGQAKAQTEITLLAIAYNLRQLVRFTLRPNPQAA
jgi:transposase